MTWQRNILYRTEKNSNEQTVDGCTYTNRRTTTQFAPFSRNKGSPNTHHLKRRDQRCRRYEKACNCPCRWSDSCESHTSAGRPLLPWKYTAAGATERSTSAKLANRLVPTKRRTLKQSTGFNCHKTETPDSTICKACLQHLRPTIGCAFLTLKMIQHAWILFS